MKSKLKILKTQLSKTAALLAIFSLLVIQPSSAFLHDTETSEDNTFGATSLVLGMRAGGSNFSGDALSMEPGDSVARDIYTQKLGELDMSYRSQFEMLAGSDTELCEALELKVWYNWYNAAPPTPGDHSTRTMSLKYNGLLADFSDFDTSSPTHDPDMQLMNSKTHYDNIFYADNEHWFYYRVVLPSDAGPELQNLTCNFNIKTTGWQTDFLNETQGFHDEEVIESIISTGNWQEIVLNEILYDPTGTDDGTMPGGEWVELYNRTSSDIDVAGWTVTNELANSVLIATSNSDNDLDTADAGETVVPANGYLVVYLNSNDFMTNDSDTISLINTILELQDTHTYTGGKPEGNTESRIPDGFGDWVDPIATPGRVNSLLTENLDPSIIVWQQEDYMAKLSVFDAINYETASYELDYDFTINQIGEQGEFHDKIIGNIDIDEMREDVTTTAPKFFLYFGTCSEGGTCAQNRNVDPDSIKLKVTLFGTGIPERTLEVGLTGNWIEPSIE